MVLPVCLFGWFFWGGGYLFDRFNDTGFYLNSILVLFLMTIASNVRAKWRLNLSPI